MARDPNFFGEDDVFVEPRRAPRAAAAAAPRARRGRPEPAPARPIAAALIRLCLRNPGQTMLTAALAAIGVAIVVNALALQTRRHPAPLFAVRQPAAEARPPVAPAMLPPARPADLAGLMAQAAREDIAPTPPARPTTRPVTAAPAASDNSTPAAPDAARPAARDSIGQLIRNVGIAEDDGARVLAAQRALLKLGYGPLKADGIAGTETRRALERFERDRKLPVTGEFGPRVLRELSAASGQPID